MSKEYAVLNKMVKKFRKITDFEPELGIILGTGLGDFAKEVKVVAEVPYNKIPGLPVSTNPNHQGKFILGFYGEKKVILMNGRVHYYEGYETKDIARPIRLMKLLGIKNMIVTNACGGVNPSFHQGDIMLIDDHISFMIHSPLIGENVDEIGTRFPDMSDVYNKEVTDKIFEECKKEKLPIQRGVYFGFTGPQYETKTEVQAIGKIGGDVCGMSTVIEAIAANHAGIKTIGISFIANMGTGISQTKLSDQEVIESANKGAINISKVLKIAIANL